VLKGDSKLKALVVKSKATCSQRGLSVYCGGVKWSAPENSPDLAHAEHILAVRAGFGQ